jgi:hypothetical protein
VSLREWLNRVQAAAAKLKGGDTLDLQFDTFKDAALQLPSLKKETGHAGTTRELEPQFQLNKRGSVEPMFEDSDIRQIGNALRLNSRVSLIAPGYTVREFHSFRTMDAEENGVGQLQDIEEAMRYAAAPASGDEKISIGDEKNYPLYLFYLMMNLPADISPDDAIPLTIRPSQAGEERSNI